MMKDLLDCTLIIPIKVEHPDRYRNAKTVLNFINANFKTNIFIYEVSESGESRLDFIEDLKNLKIRHWLDKNSEIFHRTKYLNIMLDEVTTKVVANYDIDVIIPPDFYLECQELIRTGQFDVIYPYKFGRGGQRRVLENFDHENFYASGYSIDYIDTVGPHSDYDSEYGHCIFFNTGIYKKYGAENENFISYGPEDKERGERFKKMEFRVHWLESCRIYHFEHYRGPDSSGGNPMLVRNWDVFNELKEMDKDQLIDYYTNAEYNSKYKTIGK